MTKKQQDRLEDAFEAWIQGHLAKVFSTMRRKELSVAEVALRADLSLSTVYSIASGATMSPNSRTLFKLSQAVGIELTAVERRKLSIKRAA